MPDHRTQNFRIRRYLESGKSLTALEALKKFGSMRLGARIWELKQQGVKIHREIISERGNVRYACYWMED